MNLVLAALAGLAGSGVLALLCGRAGRLATAIGVSSAWLASAIGILGALKALSSGATETFHAAWPVPGGAFALELDPLSAWFLLPIFLLAPPVALAAAGWLRRRSGAAGHWLLFHVVIAAMVLVVLARNTVLFLMAWETMVLAAWGLMSLGETDEEPAVGGALAWLVASHLGTAFLVVLLLSGQEGGWLPANALAGPHSLRFLLLALAAFGTKAALLPFHSWAGEAYGGAPGHVGALLSGAMSKLGIYGLLRLLIASGDPKLAPVPVAWILLVLGLASAGFGALAASAQRDLRRVLAATSTESAGFVVTAIAIALFGRAVDANAVAVLALTAALLHVVFDAVFKSLLFVGAGAIARAAGNDTLDRLGGLLKLVPTTGFFLLVGAAALLALPPFNGFVSELLLVVGAFEGATTLSARVAAPLFLALGTLGLVGGLALAALARATGAALLGVPRETAVASAREPSRFTLAALAVLALLALGGGLFAPYVLPLVRPVVGQALGDPKQWDWCWRNHVVAVVAGGVVGGCLLVAFAVVAVQLRKLLLLRRPVGTTVTWDCGYHRPTPRMQYTASSFGQPLVSFFAPLLLWRRKLVRPEGIHPGPASLSTETRDVAAARVYGPLFRLLAVVTNRLRLLQHGRVHLYVLAIAATLLVLLLIEVGG
jgi:formate hydrogenlyase subunit 3/multisubunit Na+/H+ antiporter MnhD subunit